MAKFDVYRNPNPRAAHARYLDIQSDLVMTSTRWCLPLRSSFPGALAMAGAQLLIELDEQTWLVDTPDVLAVPLAVLRDPIARLAATDHWRVESAVDFMLRGY